MVHVHNCPLCIGRGKPRTKFHINGKPQVYCMGHYDSITGEPFPACKECKDWEDGKQYKIDFENAKKSKHLF